MKLTKEDVEILLEAAEHWETKGGEGLFMEGLMMSMIGGMDKPKEMNDIIEKKEAKMKKEHEEKVKERKRQSVLLRAKLIELQSLMLDSKSGLTITELIGSN